MLRIDIDAAAELNYAMVHNAIPLVQRISVSNSSEQVIRDVEVAVALAPGSRDPWVAQIDELAPRGTYHLDDIALELDGQHFVNTLERERAQLSVRASAGGTLCGESSRDVDVLAYNEWSGTSLPQLLAAFVLPNHPVVAETLAVARTLLQEKTGNPGLSGYQSGDGERVRLQACAIYEALQSLDITYVNPPASFETRGQKIRTPEQILTNRMGTCLDLSVFMAACLEQAGLYPLLFMVQGHAFPGVWLLEQEIPEAVSDDGIRFRKLVDLRNLIAFDSSAVAMRPTVDFARAQQIGMAQLRDTETFNYGLDVHAARAQRFRPLPGRLDKRAFQMVNDVAAVPRAEDPDALAVRVAMLQRARAAAELPVEREVPKPPALEVPRIEKWKRKLLDLTLRNRMLNFRESKQTVRLLCPDLAALEDMLSDRTPFVLRPKPSVFSDADPRSRAQLEAQEQADVEERFLSAALAKRVLYTGQTPEELGKRLVAIFRAARESLQESGANNLCIALGMLRWYESDSSEKARLAPLILIPASLGRKSAADAFQLTSSDDETRINTTLLEKLHNDTGISIPELKEIPMDESGVDVPRIFDLFRHAVANLNRWEVVEDAYLGHFSFTKFLMWNDLQEKTESLLETEIVRHLAIGANQPYPDQGELVDAADVDRNYAPEDVLCPMDADSSQQSAILSASQGKSFVLQGPPGTGKSQTITNLIAHCLSRGKRVLFVSEKMAALDVVHRRLSSIGLGPYCLELHSHKARKRNIIEQLERALKSQKLAPPADWQADTNKLRRQRDRLNDYARALHCTHTLGISVFQGMSRLMGVRDAPRVKLDLPEVESPETLQTVCEQVEAFATASARVEPVASFPWRFTSLPGWRLATNEAIESAVSALQSQVEATVASASALSAALDLGEAPRSLTGLRALAKTGDLLAHAARPGPMLLDEPEWQATEAAALALVRTGQQHQTAKMALAARYRQDLFELNLIELLSRLRRWSGAFFLLAWWMLRGARKSLRQVSRDGRVAGNTTLIDDIDAALALREQEKSLEDSTAVGERLFGSAWMLPDKDWDVLGETVAWTGRFRSALSELRPFIAAKPEHATARALRGVAAAQGGDLSDAATKLSADLDLLATTREALQMLLGLDEEASFGAHHDSAYLDNLQQRAREWSDSISTLRDWAQYLRHRAAATKHGLAPLVHGFAVGQIPAARLNAAFERAFYQSWIARRVAAEPALDDFFGEGHDQHIAHFAELDRKMLDTTQAVACANVSATIPRPGARTSDSSEMGILLRELKKQRRHLAIRVLFQKIPNLLERLKPCILMSPLSVAQYLDPKSKNFDLVVFDEASQIPTHDAIGALARGDKAIIVGDSKQLPPTSFFQQSDNPDEEPDEDEFDELESILDECIAARVPQKSLDWHYRSRHESLIAFSNYHYYDNRLNTFPSSADTVAHLGVSMRHIDGFYDRGKSRTNRAEARAVVDEVVGRLRDPERAKHSIGVVTFSKAQQDLVEDLLDQARRQHSEIETYFNDGQVSEPVIVKNLENIQGDERDIMLFSICYGPDSNKKITMSFGPLNRDGGERRLNVAITRAREQLIVFSTLQADQIDLGRTRSVGVRHLKTFLDYAKRGPVAIAEAMIVDADTHFDSPFEEEVFHRLTARGWNLRTQVGCAGYRIDLGVYHPDKPGEFIVGIECDGAAYHSAKSARDRDRLRGQVLATLGWTLHRIWSTDWWADPEREVDRVEESIRKALDAAAAEPPAEAEAPNSSGKESPGPIAGSAAHEPAAPYEPRLASQTATSAPPSPPIGKRYRAASAVHAPEGHPADACYQVEFASKFRATIVEVLGVEAPMTVKLLMRRLAACWSIKRATRRFEKLIVEMVGALPVSSRPSIVDGVVWSANQSPEDFTAVRVPDPQDEITRRAAPDIPVVEIANAAAAVLAVNLAMDLEDLSRETARVFGITRMGGRVSACMQQGIELLVARGSATMNDTSIALG